MVRRPVRMGVDRVLDAGSTWTELAEPPSSLGGAGRQPRSIGLVTTDGAPPGGGGGLSTRKALLEAGLPLARIFTPEHGLSAAAPDGSSVADGTDPETGLPVVSLYGSRFAPGPRKLAGLDLLLFDLQDVGARFYTFLWTLLHLMEGCAEASIPLWILDRPNPLGGLAGDVEGPIQDPKLPPSLLGGWPIPIRHSLTLGEMGCLLRAEKGVEVELGVVSMEGWERGMLWPNTGIPFHPPSPGIPTFPSALLYPGLALLEATNLHEGRGTHYPFQWFGASWVESERLAGHVNEARPPGVLAYPRSLPTPSGEPAFLCPGVFLEVVDPNSHRPVALGLRLLVLLRTLWPEDFSWEPYPTAANPSGQDHLSTLLGSHQLAGILEDDPVALSEEAIREATAAPGWWERAEPHLLYS
jgi:uncharacterized protein YbbC (DUF1343 family)